MKFNLMPVIKHSLLSLAMVPMLSIASGETGWVGIEYIHQRECTGDKGFEIDFTTVHSNADGCQNTKRVDLACDQENFDQIVSIALTAMVSNKRV